MPLSAASPVTFVVDTATVHQTIDNFGASDAWSMQWIEQLPETTQQQVAQWLFSSADDADGNPQGIALSLWRYNIGAGSMEQGDSAYINPLTRTECFLDPQGHYDWSKQAGQRKFLRLAKEYGVPYLLGFLNSPPVQFTKNGLATNTGRQGGSYNLRDDCYDDFAQYMATVVEGLQQHDGITLDYLSPVNEPDGSWNWIGPKQEGTPALNCEVAHITRQLDSVLTARGLSTQILIPESSDYRCLMEVHEAGAERGNELQQYFSPDSTATYVGNLPHLAPVVAAHSYWTNTPVEYMRQCRQALRDSLAAVGRDLWMTEVCIMGNDEEIGGGGGFDRTMKTALYVARLIHHDLTMADARAWQWWRAMGGNYKDGLLFRHPSSISRTGNPSSVYPHPSSSPDTVVDSKLLWALGNYSRFVRPGAVRLDVQRPDNAPEADFTRPSDGSSVFRLSSSDTDPYGLMCSAFRNADGSIAVVLINYAATPATIALDGLPDSHTRLYRTSDIPGESLKLVATNPTLSNLSLPARSISTLLLGK